MSMPLQSCGVQRTIFALDAENQALMRDVRPVGEPAIKQAASAFNGIRSRWSSGHAAVLGWLQIPSLLSAEALARCGYDGLVVDLQHSATDFAMAVDMFVAIEAGGAEPLVRVQANDSAQIMKLLDAGARGIIVPMIETAEQALAFASAVHYPPAGCRSFGPRRPVLRYGSTYARIARQTFVALAMIETSLALENLDAILSAKGIDGTFIGPADLAMALGAEPEADSRDPRVVAAVTKILEKTHAHGKRCGIFCASAEFASEKLAQGFDVVSITPDLSMLVNGARAALATVHGAYRAKPTAGRSNPTS